MADIPRALVLGCGGISNSWLGSSAVRDMTHVVALVDLDRERAEAKADRHGLHEVFVGTDFEEALRVTKPDVVFNLTTPDAHCATSITAMEHGCHVLTEKPLADSMDGARRMIETAQAAGRTLAVAQNRRYVPQVRALKRFIASGSLGPITTVQSDFFIGAHFTGFRLHMRHVLLLDMAIHTFDAARCMTGADACTVYCHEWNPAGSWYDRDAAAVAVFEMTDGIVYTYEGSWCSEGMNTSWEGEWRIVGRNGTALWDGHGDTTAEIVEETPEGREKRRVEVPVPQMERENRDAVIAEFLRCVEGGEMPGETPETAGRDNIKSLAMVFGAIESAESERKVEVPGA